LREGEADAAIDAAIQRLQVLDRHAAARLVMTAS
jgi:hypothetical protein